MAASSEKIPTAAMDICTMWKPPLTTMRAIAAPAPSAYRKSERCSPRTVQYASQGK